MKRLAENGSPKGMLKVYEYANCDTCRKALKYLDQRGVKYERVPIVDRPPTAKELNRMLEAVGEVKKLFNTSGQLYREMGMGEKLQTLKPAEAIALLAKHGKMVKRPFVLGPGVALVGFREAEWQKALGRKG